MTQNSPPWHLKTKSLNSYKKNLYMCANCGSVAPISPSKRKQPKFPSAGERTNKAGHSYRMEHYSAIKMRWPNVCYKVDEIWEHSVKRRSPPPYKIYIKETENWWLSKLSIWEKWKWNFPLGQCKCSQLDCGNGYTAQLWENCQIILYVGGLYGMWIISQSNCWKETQRQVCSLTKLRVTHSGEVEGLLF